MFFVPAPLDFTFTAGQSVSAAREVWGRSLQDIIVPAGWTTAGIGLQGSMDGTTWFTVFDRYGAELTFAAQASRVVRPGVELPFGFRFLRFRSVTAGSPVNQGAVTLTGLFREFS